MISDQLLVWRGLQACLELINWVKFVTRRRCSHLHFLFVSGTFCLHSDLHQVHLLSCTEIRWLTRSVTVWSFHLLVCFFLCLSSYSYHIVLKLGDYVEKNPTLFTQCRYEHPEKTLKAGKSALYNHGWNLNPVCRRGAKMHDICHLIKYCRTALYWNITEIRYCMNILPP